MYMCTYYVCMYVNTYHNRPSTSISINRCLSFLLPFGICQPQNSPVASIVPPLSFQLQLYWRRESMEQCSWLTLLQDSSGSCEHVGLEELLFSLVPSLLFIVSAFLQFFILLRKQTNICSKRLLLAKQARYPPVFIDPGFKVLLGD